MIPKKRGAIFLDRNMLVFFEEGMVNPVSLTYPNTIINNLEVIDGVELTKNITTFIQSNKLVPANLVFVLSEALIFSKRITEIKSAAENDEVKAFLDTVPFETISSRLITTTGKTQVMAVNADYHTWLKNAFEANDFFVQSVVSLNEIVPTNPPKQNLDLKDFKSILSRIEQLKQFDFDLKPEVVAPSSTARSRMDARQQPTNKRTIILVIVFVCLIGILALVLLNR